MNNRSFNKNNKFSLNKYPSKITPVHIFIMSFLMIFLVSFVSINNLQPAFGQYMMDSFSARGVIVTQLSSDFDLYNDNTTESLQKSLNNKSVSTTNSNSSSESSVSAILQGEWILEVKKGDPKVFRTIFILNNAGKAENAFGIYNLRDTEYIQLNSQGTEIINGKVDFQSRGLQNETLKGIDATITIIGSSQIRILLNAVDTFDYFKGNPIVGQTRLLVDGSGNLLIGPAPPPPSDQLPSQSQNTLHKSNIF